jgi:hypothetical protein
MNVFGKKEVGHRSRYVNKKKVGEGRKKENLHIHVSRKIATGFSIEI